MDFIASIVGAAKCATGERTSDAIAQCRLALCVECEASRVGKFFGCAIVTCGQLGKPNADPDTCGCLLGACGPSLTAAISENKLATVRETQVRNLSLPVCKTVLRGERCPRGKWEGVG